MVKRFFVLFSVVASLLLASTSTFAAQSGNVDVAGIGKDVLAANPKALLDGLQTPMRNSALPKGFSDATYSDISATPAANSKDCLYNASNLSGTEGAVGYTVAADTTELGVPYVCASINYVVFNVNELGNTPLKDFKKGVMEGLGATGQGTPDAQGGLAKVIDTKVAGEPAVLLTYSLNSKGTSVVVQTLAIPVGNVFVISLVTYGDTGKVDSKAAATYANELTVAAIDHLGTVAKSAK